MVQVTLVPATTSVAVHGEVHAGTAIVATVETPQTNEFGKSIPPNPSLRQALSEMSYKIIRGYIRGNRSKGPYTV